MIREKLAKHWNISREEVAHISDQINGLYSVRLRPKRKDFCDGWEVVLLAFDGKNWYTSMEMEEVFFERDQAILHGSQWARKIKMSKGQAEQMGLPEDAFLTLKPIDGYQGIL